MTEDTTTPAPSEPVAGPVQRPVRPAAPKRAVLRWRKHKRPTGLAAVGAGPQGSTLHDGTTEYADVYPLGGGWRGPLKGWYWACGALECGEHRNTCNEPAPDEQTAKAQAMRFVKAALAKRA